MISKQEQHDATVAQEDRLLEIVLAALDDLKAVDVKVLDVREQTSITDRMVIASGTSSRHVKALANNVSQKAKEAGFPPLGVEGEQGAEWVLIDMGDVVTHVMMPEIRDFYALEKLWSVGASEQEE